MRGILGRTQRPTLGKVDQELGRRLGAGCHLEHHVDAVDGTGLARLVDGIGRCQESRIAELGYRVRQSGVDMTTGTGREHQSIHVGAPTTHRRTGVHILRGRLVEESGRSYHRRLARRDLVIGHDGLGAAVVIAVAMGIDQRLHRAIPTVLAVQRQPRRGGLLVDQRIDDDDSLVALDDRHVRQIESPKLIDAFGHFEKTRIAADLRMSP